MKSKLRKMLLLCAANLILLITISGILSSEPVFHLTFNNGLLPDIGNQAAGRWDGEKPPVYYEAGLDGPSLLIGGESGEAGWAHYPAIDGTEESGTVLFWSRGLKNWNWTWGESPGTNFFFIGGTMIYRWYKSFNLFLHSPSGRIGYPLFDIYRWTQIGFTWHGERVRVYLNGTLAGEGNFVLPVGGFRIGGDPGLEGSERIVDNLKIWDRALTESEIKRLYRRDISLHNSPVVSVPYLAAPPEIDGVIGDDEWGGTAKISGLLFADTGELAEDPSSFYLGYDDNCLYIAMHGDMTEEARINPDAVVGTFLRSFAEGRDEGVNDDDTIEIIISPEYSDSVRKRGEGEWKEYRMLANSAGGYYSYSASRDGKDISWDIGTFSKSSSGPEGWQFEARIPFSAFGRDRPLPGEQWGLQMGRIWQQLKKQHDLWAWGYRLIGETKGEPYTQTPSEDILLGMHTWEMGSVPISSSLGILQFGDKETLAIRVEKTGRLENRQMDFNATIYNPSLNEKKLSVKFFSDSTPWVPPEIYESEELLLPAQDKAEFIRKDELEKAYTSSLFFEVYDAEKNLIHRSGTYFYIEQTFDVRLIDYPHYERLLIELDLGIFSDVPPGELSASVIIKDESGNVVYKNVYNGFSSYFATLEDTTEEIEGGDYKIFISISYGDNILAVDEREFIKTGRAEWWDNRYGYEDMDRDRVSYPWTDMTVSDDTIGVLGRKYVFGGSFLPVQVETLGYSILRGPMRILLRTAGGEEIDTAAAEVKTEWTRTDKTRVEGTRIVRGRELSLANSFWSEYDGLMWNKITINPDRKVEIVSMELEIPVSKEFTDVINAYSYQMTGTGKINPEGFKSAVTTPVWIGNGYGGIQWFCETDGWFFLRDNSQSLRIEIADGCATLKIKMIDIPTEFNSPHEIEFGFTATPVRPNTWRTPEHSRYRGISGSMQGGVTVGNFVIAPRMDMAGHYVPGNIINSGMDEFCLYGYEWLVDPSYRPFDPIEGERNAVRVSHASKSFRDFYAWRHWYRQHRHARGFRNLYYDNSRETPSANPVIGTGYRRRDGSLATTFPYLAERDTTKRLYNIAISNPDYASRDSWIGYHSSGRPNMSYLAFATEIWDAENLNALINTQQPTYVGLIGPAVFRAQYLGHNLGWPVFFLGQGRIKREWIEASGGPEAVFDHIYGLSLLHDGLGVCCILPRDVMRELQSRRQQDVAALGIAHWAYQFTPYWKQAIVELPGEDIYASFYIARPSVLTATNPGDHSRLGRRRVFMDYFNSPNIPGYIRSRIVDDVEQAREQLQLMQDRAVMILYNDTEWEGVMRLKVDWVKLGLVRPEELTAVNYLHSTGFRVEGSVDAEGNKVEKAVFFERPEEYAGIEDNELVFPITQKNYRMIVIEKKQ